MGGQSWTASRHLFSRLDGVQGWMVSSHFLGQCSLDGIHCGQLIIREISKIAATRYQILRLKATKFNLRLGFTPDPTGGAYSAPQTASLYLRGLLLRGWRGREGIGEEKGMMGTGLEGCPLQLGTGSSSEGGEGREKGKKGAWVSDDQCWRGGTDLCVTGLMLTWALCDMVMMLMWRRTCCSCSMMVSPLWECSTELKSTSTFSSFYSTASSSARNKSCTELSFVTRFNTELIGWLEYHHFSISKVSGYFISLEAKLCRCQA